MPGDTLATTTLPFPTKCATCQRLYAAFKAKLARWHVSVFPSPSITPLKNTIVVDEGVRALALTFPHTLNLSTTACRTKTPTRLSDLTEGLKIKVDALETYSGMGRIYALRDSDNVLKVADIKTSWCKYEPMNYELLESKGISCAALVTHTRRTVGETTYVVMVLERLEFTMTAFIRAMGRSPEVANPKAVACMLRGILDALQRNDLVYGDLSPDNIMFRPVQGLQYELALIDPQFLVHARDYEKALGTARSRAFDTTYLALKVQAIGLLDPVVSKFANSVCAGILGHVPPEKHTRHWLLHESPVGLFMAYDILRAKNKASRST
jgi:hypothetical protein